MNHYIAFRADADLAVVLQATARERNCSVSAVIRGLLRNGLPAKSAAEVALDRCNRTPVR